MRWCLGLGLVLSLAVSASGASYMVYQDLIAGDGDPLDTYLGLVTPYEGAIGPVANYNYFSASGHPINGPTPVQRTGFVWFYQPVGDDRIAFNLIFNRDDNTGGVGGWNSVALDVLFIGDEIDPWAAGGGPRVLLSDDAGGAGELRPGAYRANLPLFGEPARIVDGRWTYVAGPPAGNRNNTDGGVLGPTTIESLTIIGLREARDRQGPVLGNLLGLGLADPNLPRDQWIRLSFTGPAGNERLADTYFIPTPEPGTLVLLALGLVGVAGLARRRRR